jgi:hypothetical protein
VAARQSIDLIDPASQAKPPLQLEVAIDGARGDLVAGAIVGFVSPSSVPGAAKASLGRPKPVINGHDGQGTPEFFVV